MVKIKTIGFRTAPAISTLTALPVPKQVEDFYRSPEWRALMAEIIKERGRKCEDPHCLTPRGPWPFIMGDHIIERKDGGAPLDKDNILLRCIACHNRKTAIERKKREARDEDH